MNMKYATHKINVETQLTLTIVHPVLYVCMYL